MRGKLLKNSRKTAAVPIKSRTTPPTGCALSAPRKEQRVPFPASRRASASFALLFALVTPVAFVFTCACDANIAEHTAEVTTGGDASRGAAAISRYGCGSCHIIPGVSGASGLAGPPLSGIASRIYIAGVLQNTPENMMRWIENPPAVDEHTVMPNLHVTHKDAADIAGYLYTLK